MVSAIIVAAGRGKRMGGDVNKQFMKLNGKEILAYTIDAFAEIDEIDEIIIVTGKNEIIFCMDEIIKKYGYEKSIKVIAGGEERQDSVYNGLVFCRPDTEIVLIHDGARPFVSKDAILDSIKYAKEYGACTVAVPAKDTIKVANQDKIIMKTLKRDELYMIQTPQTFRYSLILKAHNEARESGGIATDDTCLVENIGVKVRIIDGDYFNIKLTTPEDLIFGEAILRYMGKNSHRNDTNHQGIVLPDSKGE